MNARRTAVATLCFLLGCGSDYETGAPSTQPALNTAAPVVVAPVSPQAASADADGGAPSLTYEESAFVESSNNRDPFRQSARVVRPVTVPQRTVVMGNVPVDQMRLVAVITGVPNPRAMLADSGGLGFVVERSDYVGRGEVVQIGDDQQTAVTLNWRVDRIRAEEVVLTREDPTAPDRPPLTRTLALRPEQAGTDGARGTFGLVGGTAPAGTTNLGVTSQVPTPPPNGEAYADWLRRQGVAGGTPSNPASNR